MTIWADMTREALDIDDLRLLNDDIHEQMDPLIARVFYHWHFFLKILFRHRRPDEKNFPQTCQRLDNRFGPYIQDLNGSLGHWGKTAVDNLSIILLTMSRSIHFGSSC
jgi:hypothetical protein